VTNPSAKAGTADVAVAFLAVLSPEGQFGKMANKKIFCGPDELAKAFGMN
jgi:hypothetical protein